jgi:hypothetical protein
MLPLTQISTKVVILNCQKRYALGALGVALVTDNLSWGDVYQKSLLYEYTFTNTEMIVAAEF